MKLLISSHFFYPSVGGTEEVGLILAKEFTAAGHEVKVITTTEGKDNAGLPFQIIRNPGALELLRLVKWCEVCFHNNISLQVAWPLLLRRRPWVIAHHTWFTRTDGSTGLRDRLKKRVVRFAKNISVSEAIAKSLPSPSVVIGNPYRDDIFKLKPEVKRDRDLIFVGRLVSDKGADVLLEALSRMGASGLNPSVTIVGAGPEETALRNQCTKLGLDGNVVFAGAKSGFDLSTLLNQHRLLAITTRVNETFGIVALEAVACGCVVLGPHCGGLPEAIGPCGLTYEHNNLGSLVEYLSGLLSSGANLQRFQEAAPGHLQKHSAKEVASRYLEVIQQAAAR